MDVAFTVADMEIVYVNGLQLFISVNSLLWSGRILKTLWPLEPLLPLLYTCNLSACMLFIGVDAKFKTKEAFMRERAKARVRSYLNTVSNTCE